ncbi:MFS transporter [Leifsonia sp. 2MCAF36]|uniref:MFS transporter n=1 Tax=Leifsonia sp. 2MCAF36 TaxID=3232988 RepID=UPI003F98395A
MTDLRTNETRDKATSRSRAWAGVSAITASLFVFLTTELMPVGLLSPLSTSLHISLGTAGLMVTLQGLAAGVGVVFIVAWTRRLDRRLLLSILLTVLVVGNLVTAISPSFALILATRLLMGFASGVFWAIGVSMAMRLVPKHQASRAAAVVMSGISIATVVGIPLGTILESFVGWRGTFLIWSGLSLLVMLCVIATIPSLRSTNTVPVREVFVLPLRNARLRLVLFAVVFFVLGHFGAYTFVRPFLEQSSSATPVFVTLVLMVFGAGGALGNLAAGHAVRRSLRGTFIVGCVGLVASLLVLLGVGHGQVGTTISLAFWGLSFGIVQLCQVNMTQAAAPETFEAAMSLNTMAYNTSIALGALFGGVLADHIGVTSAMWLGVALTAVALLLAITRNGMFAGAN